MLIVMGDHGQTLNGDHGGGTAEEVRNSFFFLYSLCFKIIHPPLLLILLQVETSMFAMSTKKHTTAVPPEFDTSSCKQNSVIVTCETYSLVIIKIDFEISYYWDSIGFILMSGREADLHQLH